MGGHAMKPTRTIGWDPRYERKAVLVLALGLGLVGLDRFILMPLFPVIAKDLNLNYQDLGLISAALALTWGLSSVWAGRLADKIGRRKVIIPAVVVFSLLAGLTGLAAGMVSLLLIRAIMGISEGAYAPASLAATIEASHPSRIGMNSGIQQMAQPLLGLALAPILATWLLDLVPSWRWIFLIVCLPGFVAAMLMYRVLRDPVPEAAVHIIPEEGEAKWRDVLCYRNVVLNTIGMFCWLSCLIVLSALMPNYLIDHLGLDMQAMGFVMSGMGFGGAAGMFTLPALSDKVGRKSVMLVALMGEAILLVALINAGAQTNLLFALLFAISGLNAGIVVLTVGPLTTESVPASLMSTASGVVIGVGEIVGGGIAPAVAGMVAQTMGIEYILYIALAGVVLGLGVALAIRETVHAPHSVETFPI